MKVTFELYDCHKDAIIYEKQGQNKTWNDFMNRIISDWPKYEKMLDRYDEHLEFMKQVEERRKNKNV